MRTHAFTCCLSVLALAGWALTATAAAAATQALALVADAEPVQLKCLGADCSAEFSAFCLEPGNRSPARGTTYRLAAADTVRLLGRTEDGRILRLDPAKQLRITALRTHVAVRVAVPHRTVRELGLREIAVVVEPGAALLPAAPSGGETARSDEQIALLTGPLRMLGRDIVDRDPTRMAAARIASRMINLLPTPAQTVAEDRAGLWRTAIHGTGFARLSPAARELARRTRDLCLDGASSGLFASMRQCLQSQHDILVGGLNKAYWDALNTGS